MQEARKIDGLGGKEGHPRGESIIIHQGSKKEGEIPTKEGLKREGRVGKVEGNGEIIGRTISGGQGAAGIPLTSFARKKGNDQARGRPSGKNVRTS